MSPAMLAREDAIALALDAVTPLEREAIEARMRRDPRFAREVEAWRDVAALLAYGAPPVEPPAGLKARVRASLVPGG